MKPDYIKRFEQLGVGMFVHFGLFSIIGKGEWWYEQLDAEGKEKYFRELPSQFKVSKTWAKDVVKTAKDAGAKYITLTTRHHEGFSLFDMCGINEYDSIHTPTGRDLVREFVDECNKQGIIPFFYHTLLDWHEKSFNDDFPAYIDYLVKSVELLCKNYGKVGGFWFDGYWSKRDADWQFDRLYSTIRKYQPEAMIINNTGLSELGCVTDYEIDSVTFERGKPFKVSSADGKERAGEMCDGITDHWGYCANDLCTKPYTYIIKSMLTCRNCNCNYLINIGPMANGHVNPIEKYTLKNMGTWIKLYKGFVYNAKAAEFDAENAFVYKDDKYYYAVAFDVPMQANENVARRENPPLITLHTDKKVTNLIWMDNKEKIVFADKTKKSFPIKGFRYGRSYYARVARFKLK